MGADRNGTVAAKKKSLLNSHGGRHVWYKWRQVERATLVHFVADACRASLVVFAVNNVRSEAVVLYREHRVVTMEKVLFALLLRPRRF